MDEDGELKTKKHHENSNGSGRAPFYVPAGNKTTEGEKKKMNNQPDAISTEKNQCGEDHTGHGTGSSASPYETASSGITGESERPAETDGPGRASEKGPACWRSVGIHGEGKGTGSLANVVGTGSGDGRARGDEGDPRHRGSVWLSCLDHSTCQDPWFYE
ncbi:hypothetical protein BJX96DRAFT_146876 [Aspergillus floccosus]